MVPPLIQSIKEAGLVIVADMSRAGSILPGATSIQNEPEGVDGALKDNGVLSFAESIDM